LPKNWQAKKQVKVEVKVKQEAKPIILNLNLNLFFPGVYPCPSEP
jgi:hypothetical protein